MTQSFITYHQYIKRVILFAMVSVPLLSLGQVEICDNGIDDDFDNLIDINDDDCFCMIIEPKSLIPNPSFEERDCCPGDRSELNCATNWIQASEPTTDFIHNCGYSGWDDFPPPRPFPDGDGIMGFRDGRVRGNNGAEPYWKEYAGACLINPLLKDTVYRFQFDVGFVDPQRSPPISISFFGTSDCRYLPFGVGDDAFGCPSNSPNWKKLKEVFLSGGPGNRWVNAIIEITPKEDIYAIAIGPECSPISSPISIYYFFDNLILADLESFDLEISEVEHPCSPDYVLSVPFNPVFDYQWYLHGEALVGESFSSLTQHYGEGDYQVRIMNQSSCRLSAKFAYRIPIFDTQVNTSICNGETYEFNDMTLSEPGLYFDTLKNGDLCDVIVAMQLNVIGAKYDTVQASIIKGESYFIERNDFQEEGNYSLTLTSSLGCDSLVYLELSTFDVYIPNSFSPDGNGINDVFYPTTQDDDIEFVDMSIFDRWGNLIHKGTTWDGSDKGSGVFIYLMNFKSNDGNGKSFYGDITLFR